jgi:hypothetical protein
MRVEKLLIKEDRPMPLIAALPYLISVLESEQDDLSEYDAVSQLTVYRAARNDSYSRYDDSSGGLFKSRSDSKKDD